MKFSSSRRSLLPFVLAACAVTVLNCGGGKQEDFTSEGDSAVASGIVGAWEGTSSDGRAYVLTVCEDDGDREDLIGCETLHRVKGDGQGTTETTEEPTGCGGCNYDYSFYTSGTLEGTDLAPTPVFAQFDIGKGDKSGPAFPYDLEGSASSGRDSAPHAAIYFTGSMPSADTFTLSTLSYPPMAGVGADAGAQDAGGEADAAAPAPAPSSSGSSSPSGANVSVSNVVFHRTGVASCPSK